jgi:hypothetical protein
MKKPVDVRFYTDCQGAKAQTANERVAAKGTAPFFSAKLFSWRPRSLATKARAGR